MKRGIHRLHGQDEVLARFIGGPSDIVDNGTNVSSFAGLTATSCLVDNSLACKGIAFNGSTSRLDGRVEIDPNADVTVFLAATQTAPDATVRCLVDLGCAQVLQYQAFRTAVFPGQLDSCVFSYNDTTLQVWRYEFRLDNRAMYQAGRWRGSYSRLQSSHPGTLAVRVGMNLAGAQPFTGTITHLHVYQGGLWRP